jgi:hypothetical protein
MSDIIHGITPKTDGVKQRTGRAATPWVQVYREPVSIDDSEPFALLFRRRTRVVYGTAELIISTVGRMRQDMPGKSVQGMYMPLGLGSNGLKYRYYETLVFDTNNPGDPLETGQDWSVDFVDGNSDKHATEQHEAAVSWAEAAIQKGTYEAGQ